MRLQHPGTSCAQSIIKLYINYREERGHVTKWGARYILPSNQMEAVIFYSTMKWGAFASFIGYMIVIG